ncbi:MAG: hypothetical protein K0U64_12760 [Actinomycetia bacterium]|nr:hypothetical protein [Actinomycetes bacterium]
MTKVSFAKIGAASTAPEAPASTTVEAPASVSQPAAPQPVVAPVENLPVAAASSAPAVVGSNDVLDNDGIDAGDVKLPRLKLLQGTSDKELLAKFGFGSLLLKDDVVLAKAAQDNSPALTGRMVFVRLISKTYTERVARYGDPSMFARSLQEVDELGGTTDWRLSKENRNSGSNKSWFQVNANCLVLVEKPAPAGDDHFPFEAAGRLYCPSLYSVKSFAYDRFFTVVATAKVTGELRKDGNTSRFIEYTPRIEAGKGNAEFAVPSVKFGDVTSPELRALAAQF